MSLTNLLKINAEYKPKVEITTFDDVVLSIVPQFVDNKPKTAKNGSLCFKVYTKNSGTLFCFDNNLPLGTVVSGQCNIPFPKDGLNATIKASKRTFEEKDYIQVHSLVLEVSIDNVRKNILLARENTPLVL